MNNVEAVLSLIACAILTAVFYWLIRTFEYAGAASMVFFILCLMLYVQAFKK